ncbi:hypothetical protein BgiMline_015115, partial [Biomphalaria glabrata]
MHTSLVVFVVSICRLASAASNALDELSSIAWGVGSKKRGGKVSVKSRDVAHLVLRWLGPA